MKELAGNSESFDLESLLVLNSQAKSDYDFLKDTHFATTNILVYGAPLNSLDADSLCMFICKLVSCSSERGSNKNILEILLTRLRKLMCSHTINIQSTCVWDGMFYEVMTGFILKSNPEPSWKRLIKYFIQHDLNQGPHYNGADGIIIELHEIMQQLLYAVETGDVSFIDSLINHKHKFPCSVLPHLMTFSTLNNWTLLHYIAATRSLTTMDDFATESEQNNYSEKRERYLEIARLLVSNGASAVQRDDHLCTPLHIAAQSLNPDMMQYLTSIDTTTKKLRNDKGFTPLHTLLYTISICDWKLRGVTSQNLSSMIRCLVPENEQEILWECGMFGTEYTSTTANNPKASLFYYAVAYTDNIHAEVVAKLALTAPETVWNNEIIREILFLCAKKNKAAVLSVIMEEFSVRNHASQQRDKITSPTLAADGIRWLQYLDECMCHAAAHDAEKSFHTLLSQYAKQCTSLLAEDSKQIATVLEHCCSFVFIAVLRCNRGEKYLEVLTSIVSVLDRDLLVDMLYNSSLAAYLQPESAESVASTKPNVLVELLQRTGEVKLDNVDISPLSLLCYVGNEYALQIALKATFMHLKRHSLSVSGREVSSGGNAVWMRTYLEPLVLCVRNNNLQCARLLRSVLGASTFAALSFCEEYNGQTVIDILLRMVRDACLCKQRNGDTAQQISAIVSEESKLSSVSARMPARQNLSEMLKLLLEALSMPHKSAKGDVSSSVNASRWKFGGILSQDPLKEVISNGETDKLHHKLKVVNAQLVEVFNRLSADANSPVVRAKATFCAGDHQFSQVDLDKHFDTASELFVRATSLHRNSIEQWSAINAAINSPYFNSCLRILTTRCVPNKSWIRMAYCLSLVISSTSNSNQVNAINSETDSVVPDKLDLTHWKELKRLLSNALKGGNNATALRAQLTSLQYRYIATSDQIENEKSFALSEATLSVLSAVHNNRNIEIVVPKTSTNTENASDHFMAPLDSNRPDDRLTYLFNVFSLLVDTLVADGELYYQLRYQLLPLKTATSSSSYNNVNERKVHSLTASNSITVQQYLSLLPLFPLQEQLRYALHCNKRNDNTVSPSILHTLLAPSQNDGSASIRQLHDQLKQLFGCARLSGLVHTSSNSAKESHSQALQNKNNLLYMEHIIGILLESIDVLGCSVNSLLQYVLPCCALGLWKAATKIVSMTGRIASSADGADTSLDVLRQSLSRSDQHCMTFIVQSADKVTGRDLLRQYESTLLSQDKSSSTVSSVSFNQVTVITPLHFALYHRQAKFVERFFTSFPTYPVNLASLLGFAEDCGRQDMCATVMQLSAPWHGHPVAITSFSFSGASERKSAYVGNENSDKNGSSSSDSDHQQLKAVKETTSSRRIFAGLTDETRRNRNSVVTEMIALVEETAAFAASHISDAASHYDTISCYPFVCLYSKRSCSDEGQKSPTNTAAPERDDDPEIVLMDGSTVPLPDFISNVAYLSRALPAPVHSRFGLLGTGHTLLHQATLSGSTAMAELLLESKANKQQWVETILAVDCTGATPLYNVISKGNYNLANKMLSLLSDETSSTLISNNLETYSQLYLNCSAAHSVDSSAQSRITEYIRQHAAQRYVSALSLVVHPAPHNPLTHSELVYYGTIGSQVQSPIDLLSITLRNIEFIWTQMAEYDFSALFAATANVTSSVVFNDLESVIRARQFLSAIGVPYSQIGKQPTVPATSTTNRVNKSTVSSGSSESRFANLTVNKLKNAVSWYTAGQIKHILCGWCQNRNTAATNSHRGDTRPSAVKDAQFMFRCLESSFVSLGSSGLSCSDYFRGKRTRDRDDFIDHKEELTRQIGCELQHHSVQHSNRENMNVNTHNTQQIAAHYSVTQVKVQVYLRNMELDPAALQRVLTLSYLILDFGRLLCLARTLTAVTNSHADNLELFQTHPLDRLVEEVQQAKENNEKVHLLLSEREGTTDTSIVSGKRADLVINTQIATSPVSPSPIAHNLSGPFNGIQSRIRICDFISCDDMAIFLSLSQIANSRFNELRVLLVEGLSAIFADTCHYTLSEYVCRLTLEGFVDSILGTTANQNPVDYAVAAATVAGAAPTIYSRYKRITDVVHGSAEIVSAIQQFTVSDFLDNGKNGDNSSNSKSKFANIRKFYELSAHKINSLFPGKYLTNNNHRISPLAAEWESIMSALSGDNGAPHSSVFAKDIASIAVQRQKRIADTESNLKKAYSVATDLFWFIKSVLALAVPRNSVHSTTLGSFNNSSFLSGDCERSVQSVYQTDVHYFIRRAATRSPIWELSGRSSIESSRTAEQSLSKKERAAAHLQLSQCLKSLLQLGFHPCDVNDSGFCAVELAALSGLCHLLELMLQTVTNAAGGTNKSVPSTKLSNMKLFHTLMWHVLMESGSYSASQRPTSSATQPHQSSADHQKCIQLLLEYGFPITSPPDSVYSCLDLACWKQMSSVVLLLCAHDHVESHRASPPQPEFTGDNASYAAQVLQKRAYQKDQEQQRMLSEQKSTDKPRQPSEFVFKAVHFATLWPNVPLKVMCAVLEHSENKNISVMLKNISLQGQIDSTSFQSSVVDRHADVMSEVSASAGQVVTHVRESIASIQQHLICSNIQKRGHVGSNVTVCNLFSLAVQSRNDTVISAVAAKFSAEIADFIVENLRGASNLSAVHELFLDTCQNNAYSILILLCSVLKSENVVNLGREVIQQAVSDDLLAEVLLRGSSECVQYLLETRAVTVTLSMAVGAIVRGLLKESAVLLLLQYAVKSQFDDEENELSVDKAHEFDSIQDFLSCDKHEVCGRDAQRSDILMEETILHLCCRRGYVMIVQYLLDIGADPLLLDSHGNTALQNSIAAGHGKITQLLYAFCSDEMKTALSLMAYAIRKKLLQRVLLNKHKPH